MSKTVKPKGKHAVLIKYIAILLGAMLFGAVAGATMSMVSENAGMIGDVVEAFIGNIIVPLQWSVFLLMATVGILLYMAGLRQVKRVEANREDEAASEKADRIVGLGITLVSTNLIISYWLFGLQATLPDQKLALLSGVAVIVLFIAYYSAYMSKAIALVKRINPEKNGNPLEMKFQKDWENSCDEGEKMVIYQASFFSYKLTSWVILILWTVTVMCSMFFGLGGYAITVISIIWLAHSVGYQWKCAKLDKKKLN